MPMPMQQQIAGMVLAGGKSQRMGQDKAYLEISNSSFLERALHTLAAVSSKQYIIGRDTSRPKDAALATQFHAKFIVDLEPDQGPLGGIATAFATTNLDWLALLPCDAPCIKSDLFIELWKYHTEGPWIAPCAAQSLHPLCALIHRSIEPQISDALSNGQHGVMKLFNQCGGVTVTQEQLAQANITVDYFKNINTLAEYKELIGT
jgi:molybdopterin-guanine dinucleotide biosynthesis protein A